MSPTDTSDRLEAVCPARPTQISAIRRAVSDVAHRLGACQTTRTRVELAVTEAATNVVLHAYRDAGVGQIHVRAGLDHGLLGVSIGDDGVGMSPNPDSPGLGLGLSLMAYEADRCEIRAASGGGTEVLMHFGLGASAPAEASRAASRGEAVGASA